MFVLVDVTVVPSRLTLEEPDVFDRFSVVVRGAARPAAVRAALERLGGPPDGAHAFVEPASLLALAGSRAEERAWREQFDAMLAFARSKGWTDAAGRVRAHISRPAEDLDDADGSSSGTAIALGPGLDALCNPYRLDGRVTTHPVADGRWATMNCYLVTEGASALLIDTGLTVHESAICEQLTRLLPPHAELAILPLWFGEFGGLCNVRSIAERIGVERIHGRLIGEPWEWLDFRPDLDRADGVSGGALRDMRAETLPLEGPIDVDPAGRRRVETLAAPLRLIPMPWAYDAHTRTLLTTDVFGWVTRDRPEGPWTADLDDLADVEEIYETLVRTRYWWLPGASLERIRHGLDALFTSREVTTIAPAFGAILHGAEVVQRSVSLLDEALTLAERRPSIGVEVGEWRSEALR